MGSEPISGIRVLIVEDDLSTSEIMAAMIDREVGLQSSQVACGPHAVEAWKQGDYDVIVMDLALPSMSGIDATKYIREQEALNARKRVYIIAYTAVVDLDTYNECKHAGFDDFVLKPETFQTIIAKIKIYANKSSHLDFRDNEFISPMP